MALVRYHRHNILRAELLVNGIAVIPLLPNRMRQRGLGRPLRQHRRKDGALMTVPCREDYGDAGAFIARPPAWILVDKPPRERPRACAAGPPCFLTPLRRAGGHARSSPR